MPGKYQENENKLLRKENLENAFIVGYNIKLHEKIQKWIIIISLAREVELANSAK